MVKKEKVVNYLPTDIAGEKFKRHKKRTWIEIKEKDSQYIHYVIQSSTNIELKMMLMNLLCDDSIVADCKKIPGIYYRRNSTINFGKYKGLIWDDIKSKDPDYLLWLIENFDDEDLNAFLKRLMNIF
jgi:hypothetical protein